MFIFFFNFPMVHSAHINTLGIEFAKAGARGICSPVNYTATYVVTEKQGKRKEQGVPQ